ncbi:Uncharacterised protein [Mycobacteroides abscessus subsp. abscessus]|nr:Uncharacterised protein [Mycobacteroides abscessus subsp. abscessus]
MEIADYKGLVASHCPGIDKKFPMVRKDKLVLSIYKDRVLFADGD